MAYDSSSLEDYIDVAHRITEFRARWPDGTLRGNWQMIRAGDQDLVAYRAEAWRGPDDAAPGIGCAWELVPGRTPYTRGSELQNAETSAWGRAIIAVGAADSSAGVASREEIRNRRAERDDGLPVNKDGSLSRSRTSDEEKASAGVMTAAQQREHSALGPGRDRPADRLQAAPADDPWYESPAGKTGDDDMPGSVTRAQQQAMHAMFTQLAITDRVERLAETRKILGRPLGSSTELSQSEAGKLLTVLHERSRP
jgi:hypothetical protein